MQEGYFKKQTKMRFYKKKYDRLVSIKIKKGEKMSFLYRLMRCVSIITLLLCEACSMNHESTSEKMLSALIPQIEYKIPYDDIRHEKLENGMNILMMKNKIAPKTLLQTAYNIGSAVEDSGETGLAHLLEHMIFKGTKIPEGVVDSQGNPKLPLDEGDIDGIARFYGATFNAFTSKDMTSYYFEVDKNNWKAFMPILSDCMQFARLDKEHLASELHAVVQELKMYKDSYWRRMIEQASSLVFPSHHPYHCPIIGYKEDLAAMSADRLQAFYKKYYHPERATLIIMGDIDFDEVMQEVRAQFGHIPYSTCAPIRSFPTLTPELTVHDSLIYEVVKKPQLGFYWAIPGVKQVSVEMLSMIAGALGGGEGSRLYKRLVDDLQIADSLSVDPYLLLESGIFLILIEPKDDAIDACKKEVTQALKELMVHGITSDEMQKTVVQEASSFFQMLTDLQSLAYEWLVSFYATNDPHALFTKIDALYGVKKEDIQVFVKKYLDPFLMSQVTLLPVPDDKKQLWQDAKDASDAVDKEILSSHVRQTIVEKSHISDRLSGPDKLAFAFPKPASDQMLSNGLRFITYERNEMPLIHINLMFKDTHALSNLLEGVAVDCMMSLLMEGSTEYSKDTLVNFFEQAGAEYGFSVSGGSLSCFTDGFEKLLEVFMQVIESPAFSVDALEKIKAQMIESYIRAQDAHVSVGRKALKNALYKGHPYAWTFDDAIKMLKKLTLADMKRLHKKYVRPERMLISAAGALCGERGKAIVSRVVSTWKGEGAVEQLILPPSERTFEPLARLDIPMMRDQAVLLLGQPSSLNLFNADYIPVKLLNFICFYSLGSRIYALREQTGLFYNAQGGFAVGSDREKGYDFTLAIVNPENLSMAETKLKEVLKTLQEEGITEEELNAARQLYLKGLIDATVHVNDIATMLGNLALLGLPFDYYDTVLQRVQTISVAELNEVAKKYASPDRLMTIRVGRV